MSFIPRVSYLNDIAFLPGDFMIDTGLRISGTELFDPTDKASVLMQ